MDSEKLDEKILQEIQLELRWMPGVDPRHVAVKVSVKSGVAILFGHVPDPSVRRAAEKSARRVLGVRSVVNEIKLHHLSSDTPQEFAHGHVNLEAGGPESQPSH
jgi:osmotically-inducible protein OsmY